MSGRGLYGPRSDRIELLIHLTKIITPGEVVILAAAWSPLRSQLRSSLILRPVPQR